MPDDSPVLLIFPGLTASSKSLYVRYLVQYCRSNNIKAGVFIYRGFHHELDKPMCSSSADVSDIDSIISAVKSDFPKNKLAAVGFSMGFLLLFIVFYLSGANMLAKVLGSGNNLLDAAMVVSNGWDFVKLSNKLESFPQNFLYSRPLSFTIKRNIFSNEYNRKMLGQLGYINMEHALKAGTIRELDDRLTRHLYQIESVDEYYARSSV